MTLSSFRKLMTLTLATATIPCIHAAAELPPDAPAAGFTGPVSIATVYPILDVQTELLHPIQPKVGSFDFWGTETLMEGHGPLVYFDETLSHPFAFSDEGVAAIRNQLRGLESIKPETITTRHRTSPPSRYHSLILSDATKKELARERYVEFRLSQYPDVTVMFFPAFVVVMFEFGEEWLPLADYHEIAESWRKIQNDFTNNRQLQDAMGISRKSKSWSTVPILSIVASPWFDGIDFSNRYLGPYGSRQDRHEAFLKEMSIDGPFRKGPAKNWLVRSFSRCFRINLEDSVGFGPHRQYYTSEPLFSSTRSQESSSWPIHLAGGVPPHLVLHRIVKAALLANVILPFTTKKLANAHSLILGQDDDIAEVRTQLFSESNRAKIGEFYHRLIDVTPRIASVRKQFAFARIATSGIHNLREHLASPWTSPFDPPLAATTDTGSKVQDPCYRLFDFESRRNVVTDRRKVDTFERDIEQQVGIGAVRLDRLETSLAASLSLAEQRRTTLESYKSGALIVLIPALFSLVTLLGLSRFSSAESGYARDISLTLATILALVLFLWLHGS